MTYLALIHYGNSQKAVYLAAANNLSELKKIPRGKSLWIPTVWTYRLKKGESLARVATKYLKDPSWSDFLVWLNHIRNPRDIDAGTPIIIPFLLRHRVEKDQSMVDVAKRYYFGAKHISTLRRFNNKKNNVLKTGEVILVPIFDPDADQEKVTERLKNRELQQEKLSAEAKERAKRLVETIGGRAGAKKITENIPGPDSQITPRGDAASIQEAFELYQDGEYQLSRDSLERVLEPGRLSASDEAEAREILAFCLIAMDHTKEAEQEFVRVLKLAPKRTLDSVNTSPKIMEVFKRAKEAL